MIEKEEAEYNYQMRIREMSKHELIEEITKLNNYIKGLQDQNRELQGIINNVR